MVDTEQKNYGYGKKPLWQWVLIYLVVGGLIYAAIYYFYLAKKGGYSYNQPASVYPSPQQANTTSPTGVMMVKEMKVILGEENSSGQSGTANLKEIDGKVTVDIMLSKFTDVDQPAHIHVGVCPGVGEVKYPLNSVVNGKSSTVLPVTLDQLKQELPLAINVHKSKTELSVYSACGELSAK